MAQGFVRIEEDRCKGCGLCVDECPQEILALATTRFNHKGYRPVEVIDMAACTGCAVCAVVCPDVAFEVFRAKKQPKATRAA